MAIRATGRTRVLASRAIHRHYLETTATYFSGGGFTLQELPTLADGTTDLAATERALADGAPVAGVLLGQPNAFGVLEPMADAARLAHAAGALFVAVVEPVSLAVLATPGEIGAQRGRGSPWVSRCSSVGPTWASSRPPKRSSARSLDGSWAAPRTSRAGAPM